MRIDTLKKGQEFIDRSGKQFRYVRSHVNRECVWVVNLNTLKMDCFANCADVQLIARNL